MVESRNHTTKKIMVSFYNIDVEESFFSGFVSSYIANKEGFSASRFFNLRDKKHLIKLSDEYQLKDNTVYAVTAVRERNSWQVRATSDGKLSGISLNQGIIGDPYFFFISPEQRLIFGFTTGPSGSVKSVAKTVLEQFKDDRSQTIRLDLIPKQKEPSTLDNLPSSGEINLKIKSNSLIDVSESAPELVRNIASDTLVEHNVQLILNLPFSDEDPNIMSKSDIIDLINYFSEHDGCLALQVSGSGDNGEKVRLDFGNTFHTYRTQIATRNKFIDEATTIPILQQALKEYLKEININH